MIGLIQRVSSASVMVDGKTCGQIDAGILALIGIQKDDDQAAADKLLQRILNYRIFEDDNGNMNLSLSQTGGGLLLVSQFTLAADTHKGRRPSFSSAAPPAQAETLYDYLTAQADQHYHTVATGVFAADMTVALVNDGPVTFWLES